MKTHIGPDFAQPAPRAAKLRHYLRVMRDYARTFGPVGLLYLVEAVVVKRPRLVRVRRKWSPQPLFVRLATSDVDVFRQVFLEEEYGISAHINQPVSAILDAGANIGLASIFFIMRYPSATVIAVEPDHSNYEVLNLNCHAYNNIFCVEGALWRADAALRLKSEDARSCSFTVEPAIGDCAKFQGYRVSTLLNLFELNRLSILKMDIEGAEIEVFSDSNAWEQRVDSIIVELHDRKRTGCTDAFHAATHNFTVKATTRELTLAVQDIKRPQYEQPVT